MQKGAVLAMQLYTSCYARLKKIQADPEVHPVAISVGVPRWYTGPVERRLAPTRAMLKMDSDLYDQHYDRILEQLDPREIAVSLGSGAALLCWEAPGAACHRRRVAEWLESALGIVVPEYGFQPGEIPVYKRMPEKAPSTPKKRRRRRGGDGPLLF